MAKINIREYEKRKAIDILVSLGAANYVNDMELYHGRAGNGTTWKVDPLFNNAGNITGNRNVYDVKGLYSGTRDIAEQFALKRVRDGAGSVVEIHKIKSQDDYSIVFNLNFNIDNLTDQQKTAYYSALDTLSQFSLTQASPLQFEYKNAWPIVVDKCQEVQRKLNVHDLTNEHIGIIVSDLKKDIRIRSIFKSPQNLITFVEELVSAYNTRYLLKYLPITALDSYISANSNYTYKNSNKTYPCSSSYTSAWCAHNHVVGISQRVDSATLKQTIDSNILFDTKKIVSEKQHGEMLQHALSTYADLTNILGDVVDENTANLLINGNSQEIIGYTNKSLMCRSLYNKSANIWEGWTVGQHTEAVLNFFEKYYTEEMPDSLKPFMKIVLLAHDIGKGYAAEKNITQEEGNLKNTKHLYNFFNLKNSYRQLIDFIINDSQKITSSIVLNKGDKQELSYRLKQSCRSTFFESFKRYPNTSELKGLTQICKILQSCDSGAYTRYAEIREGNKIVHGANDKFTESFVINSRGDPRLKVFEDEMENL